MTRPSTADRGQLCPVCRLPPTSAVEHRVRGVVLLNLICPMEHLWQTKWVEA